MRQQPAALPPCLTPLLDLKQVRGIPVKAAWTYKRAAAKGRAFLISGSVGARPPPLRGSGPLD